MQELKEITKEEVRIKELKINFENAMKDPNFKQFIDQLHYPKNMLIKYTSKFEECCQEVQNCKHCKGIFECKNQLEGHRFFPKIIQEKLYFTYLPCKYQKKVLEKEEKSLQKIMMKDIDPSDKKQLKIIKWLDDFYENFDLVKSFKGLYLHGSFGSGKTYLITALLNELEKTKHVQITMVYFPDALRDLKEDWENFSYKMKNYMEVDILFIDDIGAEKVTEWGRDEILGTILQARMNHHKTTFFTSNLTILELEEHLSIANNSVDKVKSRRIIERIKQLTEDMELISENRRK